MNLPNKITVLRVFLIPIFLFVYLSEPFDECINQLVSFTVFGLASLTDALDGYIARRRKQITNFGKLMDPLADKLLVSAALIAMAAMGGLSVWVVVILISREFFISGFRQLALEQGLVLAASVMAKAKTIVQMIMILYLLLPLPDFGLFDMLGFVLVAGSMVLSIVSAAEYAVRNKQVFR